MALLKGRRLDETTGRGAAPACGVDGDGNPDGVAENSGGHSVTPSGFRLFAGVLCRGSATLHTLPVVLIALRTFSLYARLAQDSPKLSQKNSPYRNGTEDFSYLCR